MAVWFGTMSRRMMRNDLQAAKVKFRSNLLFLLYLIMLCCKTISPQVPIMSGLELQPLFIFHLEAVNSVLPPYLLKHSSFSHRVRGSGPRELLHREELSFLLFLVMCSSIFRSLHIMRLCCAEPGLHTKQEKPKLAAGLKASFA